MYYLMVLMVIADALGLTVPDAPVPAVVMPSVPANHTGLNEVYRVDPEAPRGTWSKAIMALHHATGGSAEGLAIAIQWSRPGDKIYADADVEPQNCGIHSKVR